MTPQEIIQVLTGMIGSLCFGVLFNIRGKKLAAVAIGGFFSWSAFVILSYFIPSEPMNYFIVAAATALYAEIMARVLKTPATPLITTSLIPLIPGSALYYTMAYAFGNDMDVFLNKAVDTLKLAAALALGIIVVTALSHIFFPKRRVPRPKK